LLDGDLSGPNGLGKERLERAIGVIYLPDTEMASHYFWASLPQQFDEYVWFDETLCRDRAGYRRDQGLPDTYPLTCEPASGSPPFSESQAAHGVELIR
jgi:hypothetical protein